MESCPSIHVTHAASFWNHFCIGCMYYANKEPKQTFTFYTPVPLGLIGRSPIFLSLVVEFKSWLNVIYNNVVFSAERFVLE